MERENHIEGVRNQFAELGFEELELGIRERRLEDRPLGEKT